MIAKLIQYTIETGMLTSIVAFVNLALWLTREGSEDYYWAWQVSFNLSWQNLSYDFLIFQLLYHWPMVGHHYFNKLDSD
jgi:hypothetical protein